MTEETLFHEALAKANLAERAAFLDTACFGQPQLRQTVEALLAAHDASGHPLDRPVPANPIVAGGQALQPEPGLTADFGNMQAITVGVTIAGRYKLLEQLGEGGMGTVWVAEQMQPVRRKVALKLIKAGMDSKTVVSRFEAERQALALMDHPNIAKVLDGGTTGEEVRNQESGVRNQETGVKLNADSPLTSDPCLLTPPAGRPFFVMEYVKGVPITQYCDDARLSVAERLELFVPVCQAVQHAHQKGIIHRDLKPSNILICLYDGRPVPKVIDFGLAKAMHQPLTEHTLYTAHGLMMGTPLYMSPEQAEFNNLDVDTRTDIYALGVILYELLTGTTPLEKQRFKEAAWQEMLRLIKDEEPPRPSNRLSSSATLASVAAQRRLEPVKLTNLVRGELDWIVMKCLEKERSRRYETANGLAHDIERYLLDEPVEACPPSPLYRLKKFARKHRSGVLTAAALAGMLVFAVAVSTWQAARATRAEQLARSERDEKEMARQTAVEAELAQRAARESEAAERRKAEEARDAKVIALQQAQGLRLTAQSSVALASNPGLGLLLAIEGAQCCQPRSAAHNNALLAALRACREVRTLHGNVAFRSARFSRDGRFVLTTSTHFEGRRLDAYESMAAQVWDAGSGRLVRTVRVPGLFFGAVDLSPDGQRLLACFEGAAIARYADGQQGIYTDRVVRIWDVATGQELAVLKGHANRVVAACFSPDGKQVLTASWDCTARQWDAASGKQLFALAKDRHSLASAAFSPDGGRVLTLSSQSKNVSEAAVSKEQQKEGWKSDTPIDPPLRSNAVAQKIQSLYSSGSGGSSWHSNEETRSRARLWDSTTGAQISDLMLDQDRKSAEKEPTCAAFSPDGRRVLTGDVAGTTSVWDAADGKRLTQWEPPPWRSAGRLRIVTMSAVALSYDGRRLLRRHAHGSISVVDTATRRELAHFSGFTAGVRSTDFSPDGQHVLILPGDKDRIERKGWNPGSDGELVLNVRDDRTVYLRDVATGLDSAVFLGHDSDVTAASFSPDGRQVVTASIDGTVRLWNTGPVDDGTTVLRGHQSAIGEAAFSPDGQRILTAFGLKHDVTGAVAGDQSVRVWNLAGKQVSLLKGLQSLGDSPVRDKLLGGVRMAQFSPDGRWVLMLSKDCLPRLQPPDPKTLAKWPFAPVRIFDAQTSQELLALKGFTCDVRSAAFSPDGRLLLAVSGHTEHYRVLSPDGAERGSGAGPATRDPLVRIWDATTGAAVSTLIGKGAFVCAAWHPDGRRIVTAGLTGTSKGFTFQPAMWDAMTGQQVGAFEEKLGQIQIDELHFSPDGKRVLGLRRIYHKDDEHMRLWDAESGKTVAAFTGHQGEITSAAFSSDSRWVATTSLDGTARIWSADKGQPRFVLIGHERAVHRAAFSPDGRWVVTASDDATARIWDAATGKEFYTLTGHGGPVFAAGFSPDGQRVLTASGDGTARLWPVDPLPIALARKPRELTPEERQRFNIDDQK